MRTLYAVDLDGTFLDSNNKASDVTVEIINDLIRQGMLITYSTARSWHSAHPPVKNINFNIPCIVYSGAFFVEDKTGKHLREIYINNKDFSSILNLYKHNDVYPMVYAKIDNRERIMWIVGKETPGIKRYLNSRKNDPRLLPISSFDEFLQGYVIGITLIDKHKKLSPLVSPLNDIEDVYAYLQSNVYVDDEFWLEIYSRQANKHDSIIYLKNQLNADRIVSFGDNVTDLRLFEASDISVAVANSKKEILEIADIVIGTNDQDSVAKFIKYDYKNRC